VATSTRHEMTHKPGKGKGKGKNQEKKLMMLGTTDDE
jgi:hypothetical protein